MKGRLKRAASRHKKSIFGCIIVLCIASCILPLLYKQMHKRMTETRLIEESFEPSITFCAVPYPVTTDRLLELYLLTMSSWLSVTAKSKLLILMPREQFDPDNRIIPVLEQRFGKHRVNFTDHIECDESGVPFIDDWFIKGYDSSTTSLVCWINSDIITPNGWYQRVKFVVLHFVRLNKQSGVVSRRCDFDYTFNNNYSWPIDYDLLAKGRKTHSPWGVDFYLISKEPMQLNIDEIPPFHMGKYRWDPWMTGWLNQNLELTSLGDGFCTYHVNHVPKPRNMEDVKVKENFEIAARNGRHNINNHQTRYKLVGRDLYHENVVIDSILEEIPPDNSPPEKI